tara:strand:- start:25 stop:774 length:750 start_codon:yes stop_codon:yes gene_type:complete
MATYTDEQLQTAAARLREIYDVQTRAERLRTARRFGYESKPDSRLRIYRRLTRGKAKPFSRFSATEYLNDYVLRFDQNVLDNDGDEMVLNGKVPPYSFSQNMLIVSSVMFVVRKNFDFQTFNTEVNRNPLRVGRDKINLDPMKLLLAYQERVREKFLLDPAEGYELVAVAFTMRGAELLAETYETVVPDPDKADYGAAFLPTKARYVDDKRQPFLEQQPTFRPFPKARQERIVRYVNRAYPQLKRSGRL